MAGKTLENYLIMQRSIKTISQLTLFSHRSRRPKIGSAFALVRLVAWFLKIVGVLLVGLALLGFIVTLVKASPTLIGALQFPEQKMAGFVILITLGGLLAFVLLGLSGSLLVGIGFAFHYWGTEPAAIHVDH